MPMDPSTAKALAELQKRPEGGESLFEHLSNLVANVLDSADDSLDLATLSKLLKKQTVQEPVTDAILPYRPVQDGSSAKQALALFGDRAPPIDPDTGMPIAVHEPNAFECDNMAHLRHMLEAVGQGLSAQEMYGAMLQMKRLGEDPSLALARVRFFGKVFGIFADYYVFEADSKERRAEAAETSEEQAQREAEGRYPVEQGSGVNAHVYFVCNALGDPRLTRLPDARPEHIVAARDLKRLLTGRLSSAVSMYPPFPWDEAVFLRAQIARIAAATVLAPAGWYSLEEDDGGASVVTRAEEIEPVAAPEGEAEEWLASWVHREPHLKRQGRCEARPVRTLPEDAEEEVELTPDEQEEAPEGGQVLALIADDGRAGGGAAWTAVRSSASAASKGQVLGVRSVRWPGALAVTHGRDAFSVYVGWALKSGAFVPLPPPPIAEEFDQAQLVAVDLPVKADPDAAPAAEAEGGEDEA